MSPSVIEIHDVSKRFVIRKEKSLKERLVNFGRSNLHKEDFWALRNVDATIESGSTVGLIGANGSGKSTLLKMIGGILQPTSGSVQLRGRLAALLELGAGFHPDLTGRENVYLNASILGLTRRQTDKYFDAIVDFSGIEQFIDTQVKFYSSGMYVRLAFAVAVHVDPDILLVDEVLAVGDEPFQRKCMDRIRGFQQEGRTIVLVTHSLDQVADLCDRAIVLEHGRVLADDVPRDALRVLRADFETTRQKEVEQATDPSGTDRPKRPNVSIAGVRVIADDDPAEQPTIAPTDSLTIEVVVDAGERLEDWILGIGIDNPLGVVVYGTNTRLLGTPLPPLDGSIRYAFRLPAIHLGEGEYTIHASVATGSGQEVARLPIGGRFMIRADGRSQGYLFVPAEFRGEVDS
ncbi:ABC transporter ATP-binding protein [Actinotalea sp. K2]|uniref:ABC transporter ATP-binding protein n=1 Tax=Actinotalea sp. K2 TaxID=2939438 RepID=UPI002016B96B|nr:ABC transporter ATP-binding protein [Actinotalea sp. K2]MCL3862724.1 ABC transporter ATP-binding protein [Actinotalea sp. K2]